ncbi:hypothetical protein BGX28_007736 [Mortierella sp. GBA30]|nr:hypothetical protein BGX28_007736 [Mortierella sp. GBA30]
MSLDLRKVDLGYGMFKALPPSFHYLKKLVLHNSTGGMTSVTVRNVLMLCPQLKEICASRLLGDEVVKHNAPWVCGGLISWSVGIEVKGSAAEKQEHHELLFKRLLTFSKLKSLDVTCNSGNDPSMREPFSFSLENGLDTLATLTRLDTLDMSQNLADLYLEDMQWMTDHWNSLLHISGTDGMEDVSMKRDMRKAILESVEGLRLLRLRRRSGQRTEKIKLEFKEIQTASDPRPLLDAVRRHRSHIQELELVNDIPSWIYNMVYPTLNKVIFRCIQEPSVTLISRNPTIAVLHLCGPERVPGLWKSVAALPNLKELVGAGGPELLREDNEDFWKACSGLDSLMWQDKIPSVTTIPSPIRLKIRRLELVPYADKHSQNHLDLIARCRLLKTVMWWYFGPLPQETHREYLKYVNGGFWPGLEDLSLATQGCSMTDRDIAVIVGGMKRVVSLSLPKFDFGPLSFQALRPSFHCLKKISVFTLHNGMTSKMVQEVLASCRQLEDVRATRLSAWDVAKDGRPWVCAGLKKFKVCIEVRGTRNERLQQHWMMFQRFSALRNLEALGVHLEATSLPRLGRPFMFSLENGLAALVTLTQLNNVNVDQKLCKMGASLRWMVSHWKKLEFLAGSDGTLDAKRMKDLDIEFFDGRGGPDESDEADDGED